MASNLLEKFHSPVTPSAAITTDADKTTAKIMPARIVLIDFIIRFSLKKWRFCLISVPKQEYPRQERLSSYFRGRSRSVVNW
jgi:hypothetical protein